MRWLSALWLRLKRRTGGDLSEELRFHLEKEVELNVERGMPIDEARRRALVAFGGVQQARENVIETRWMRWIEVLIQDCRYGWRMLRKSPGVTAIAVTTLALGIGMNTAIFSLIDAVLFRALPGDHPEQLVVFRWHARHRPKLHSQSGYGDCRQHFSDNDFRGCSLSLPFLNLVREQTKFFAGTAAFAGGRRFDLSGNGAAVILNSGEFVSGDYFQTLGVRAAAGRTISPADDRPEAAPVVMLSYGYWQSAFGASADAVGRTIKLNGIPATIIGVAQPNFIGLTPGHQADVWMPFSFRPRLTPNWRPEDEDIGAWWMVIVARLKPGITIGQAQAAITVLFRDQGSHAPKPLFTAEDDPGMDLLPAQQGLDGGRMQILAPLYILMLAVALVLLIACANIAGLLLARVATRSREIAVRLVLGAKRSRLISQLLIESVLLSVIGGTLGLLVAQWAAKAFLTMTSDGDSGPLPFTPRLDERVLVFTAAIAIITGLIFGLAPALRSLRVDLTPALKVTDANAAGERTRGRWYSIGNVLVVAQVSFAVVALLVAGLLVRTLNNLKSVDLGFDTRNVLTFGLDPVLAGYKKAQLTSLYRDLQSEFAALPGVVSVSHSWAALLSGGAWGEYVHAPGTPATERVQVDYMPIGPGFLETMRIPLKAGRAFSPADFSAAEARFARPDDAPADPHPGPHPAIVNEAFVRRIFPTQNPLGQHVERPVFEDDRQAPASKSIPSRDPGWEIVGVVSDAKYGSLRREIKPTLYEPSSGSGFFSIRTAGDPLALVAPIREIVNRKDSNLAMYRIATEEQQIEQLVVAETLVARLSTAFGILAVVLACLGLYGLLSYEVTRRTREIGIRMAVGAQQSHVVGMVVRHGLLLALIGAVIGSVSSLTVNGLLKSILYKVKMGDPVTLAGVGGLVLLVALVACYVPARRATRVHPLEALRYE